MRGVLFSIWFVFASFLAYGCLWFGTTLLMYSKHPVPVVMAFVVAFWAGVSALVYGMLRLIAWVLLRLVAWVFEKPE
jgi:hypothetical protein